MDARQRVRRPTYPIDHTLTISWNSSVWFKIDEAGKTADGKWAATDGLYATDSIYTITIPPKLKAGQYIIRHEMFVFPLSTCRITLE